MSSNNDPYGAGALAFAANLKATIEKEEKAADDWWQQWGFLAAREGILPTNRNQYISALEKKYIKMQEGQPVPGFSRQSTEHGKGKPIEFGNQYGVRKMKHITPTDPY